MTVIDIINEQLDYFGIDDLEVRLELTNDINKYLQSKLHQCDFDKNPKGFFSVLVRNHLTSFWYKNKQYFNRNKAILEIINQ